jgi:hypothetical protein
MHIASVGQLGESMLASDAASVDASAPYPLSSPSREHPTPGIATASETTERRSASLTIRKYTPRDRYACRASAEDLQGYLLNRVAIRRHKEQEPLGSR